MIKVTEPFLPPLEEFEVYLRDIWDSRQLTNNGKYHGELEKALCDYLGVKYISLFSNGTLALIAALRVLDIQGEVITTPFSFVATAHSLLWNNIKPVFVDIDSVTLNIDPEKIEAAVTPGTTAILPVHVFGNPCNVERIAEIAKAHNLKVIYDACHTFGVKLRNVPILNFGDLSVMSFHATKIYNTFEGGAIICHDAATKKRIDYLKNFGFEDEISVVSVGINAKMNEFQSALGLLQLKYIDNLVIKRKAITAQYRRLLINIPGITYMEDMENVKHCYSYFPLLIDKSQFGRTRDQLYEELKKNDIFGRRYFYPLISHFSYYRDLDSAKPENLEVAENIAAMVLCLPIYPGLELSDVDRICDIIRRYRIPRVEINLNIK